MTPHNNLWLFKDMNVSFSPSIDWLDGGAPAHPFFDQHEQIQAIASQIKSLLLSHALEGVQTLVRQSRDPVSRQLVDCLHEQPEVWKAVLATQRYDGIYFFNRSDSRQWKEMWSGSQSTIILIRKIDDFLQGNHIGTKALNCAVHAYVHDKSIKVERETRLIPDRAISCRGENQIAVNDKSFRDTAEDNLGESKPLYDLHDFAHLTTATLCSELFGNQYHPKLTNLPPHLTALIRSPNLKLRQINRGHTPLASDGIVFSEFLTKLFAAEVENNAQIEGQVKYNMRYQQLTASLASKVAEYLMGRGTLIHNTTGTPVKLAAAITPVQLAVLVQNKAYELTASEIEQRVFFRGRVKEGEPKDELEGFDAWQRIETLAANRHWTYFEVRNTIKHRAHKEAYRLVAEELLAAGEETVLCKAILDNITYEDWTRGERVNLWDMIASSERFLNFGSEEG